MDKLGNDEVKVRVLHSGVGAITESDVTLAEASGAPIIGFNVRANAPARTSAQQKGVEIRYYSIIYNLVDDIKAAASGLLSDEVRETFIGYATIKEVFKITGTGKVAGCIVTEGVARRSAGVRLLRDNVVIHTGKLKTLKRFKDEVKEVQVSQECGMAFENYEDIREGDVIEISRRRRSSAPSDRGRRTGRKERAPPALSRSGVTEWRNANKKAAPAPTQRQLRVGEVVRRALSEALMRGETHEPELDGASITVSEVRLSPDLKIATAYVMPLGGANGQATVKALARARASCGASSAVRPAEVRAGSAFPARQRVRSVR